MFEVIKGTIGFPLLNSLVLGVMERWIYSELLKQMGTKSETNCLKAMIKFCEMCKIRREKTLQMEHADTIRSKHLLACITRALDNPEYLHTLKSRDDGLVTEAEHMTREELKVKAQKIEEDAKVVKDKEATKRGNAVIEAQKARLEAEAEEKARLEAEAEKKARLEAEEKARLEAEK